MAANNKNQMVFSYVNSLRVAAPMTSIRQLFVKCIHPIIDQFCSINIDIALLLMMFYVISVFILFVYMYVRNQKKSVSASHR